MHKQDYVGITCSICNNTSEGREWAVNRRDPIGISGHTKKINLFSASESVNLMPLMRNGDQDLLHTSTKDTVKAIHRYILW